MKNDMKESNGSLKITGADLAIECDAYDEFNSYLDDCKAVAHRNTCTARINLNILRRNVSELVSGYCLAKSLRFLSSQKIEFSEQERKQRSEVMKSLKYLTDELRIIDSQLNKKQCKEGLEFVIESLNLCLADFTRIHYELEMLRNDSFKSVAVTLFQDYETYPIEPDPPVYND